MKVNKLGLELIKEFEGLYLDAYICPAGVATIGWGTTIYPNGSAVRMGDRITARQAEEYLAWDLENKYCRHVRESVVYPLLENENQFSALVSFVYNVGRGGLHAPNSIDRRIKNGEKLTTVISEELPRWNKGGGGVLAGLVRRRQAELKLFFTESEQGQSLKFRVGDYSDIIKGYQKDLNIWLAKWKKRTLSVDGVFGQKSLEASNDFAKNNKLEQNSEGVSVELYNAVVKHAKSETPVDDEKGIKVFQRGQDVQLSKNFHLREFTCKCGVCRNQPISLDMIEKLQKLRDLFGVPFSLTSAYRCPTHNYNVGGASESRHMVGDAVDISINNLDWAELVAKAKGVGFTGIGYGQHKGFIHVDLGEPREWDY